VLTALHFFTHIGLSWIVASLGRLSRKDRWLVLLAGVVLDLDGVGMLWSEHAYRQMHRAIGHSLLFGLLVTVLAMLVADTPRRTGALAAAAFLLHLALDVVGTGGAPIRFLWPLSDWTWTYDGHWVLASWQNALVMALTLGAVLLIARRNRRRSAAARG
jgi:membrane-bound metal-dependent hydrolase YbcI (DUF457 family)